MRTVFYIKDISSGGAIFLDGISTIQGAVHQMESSGGRSAAFRKFVKANFPGFHPYLQGISMGNYSVYSVGKAGLDWIEASHLQKRFVISEQPDFGENQ